MRPKIFNAKLLIVCALLVGWQGSFAQAKTEDEKAYTLKMQKLQSQMHELQKEMSQLQKQKIKEQSAELRKLATELSGQARTFTNELNVSGFSKGLGITGDQDAVILRQDVQKLQELKVPNGATFNYNNDKALQEKVQSGELFEKIKNYSKSYPADGNDKLQISNSYGKVTVNTWTKNEVKVDIQIKTYANKEDEAQKMLDNISIIDSKDNSLISFKTNIERTNDGNSNWGSWFSSGRSNVRKSEINYVVYMPSKNQLQITNRYGATVLPDLYGKVQIENTYGSLTAKTLSNPANEIKVRYGSANIENLNSRDVSVAYGSLTLGEADNLNAEISYSSANFGKLKSSATISARYCGSMQIGDLDKNLKSLSVNSSYSSLKVGLPENLNADFDVTVHYGSFNYGNRAVTLANQQEDDGRRYNSTKTFKGSMGKGNSDKTIMIKANYGSVKFD
jgi:hypothetical protein